MGWTARFGISRRRLVLPDTEDGCTPRRPRIPRTPHGFQKLSRLRHERRRASNPAVPPNTRRDTRPAPRRDPIPGVPCQASSQEQSGNPGVLGGRRHGGGPSAGTRRPALGGVRGGSSLCEM